MTRPSKLMQIRNHLVPLPAYDRVIDLNMSGKPKWYNVRRICRIASLKENRVVDEIVQDILSEEDLIGQSISEGFLDARSLWQGNPVGKEEARREAIMSWEEANLNVTAARQELERTSTKVNSLLLGAGHGDCEEAFYRPRKISGQVHPGNLKKGDLLDDPAYVQALEMELDAMAEVERTKQLLELRKLAF